MPFYRGMRMSNRILYLGAKNVFFSAINFVMEKKNYELFQFESWGDCLGQLEDLDVFYIFVDCDTCEDALASIVKDSQIPVLCFTAGSEAEKSVKIVKKPVSINDFEKEIDKVLKGQLDG